MARPPSVDALVREIHDGSLPRPLVVDAVRRLIAEHRDEEVDYVAEARRRLDLLHRSAPRRVINATGVILHTNLGRAPWSAESLDAAQEMAAGYGNVELDLNTGDRGRRNDAAERLALLVTGAEAAMVVNNNAAALFLVLMALAPGGRVPVSRGELIEIGGSYRLPELMAAAGAKLVEVGTTNRTRLSDYEAVEDPALFLKVHPSNYRVTGFSAETRLAELAELAEKRERPLVFDQGSGLLDERVPWLEGPPPAWLNDEPGVIQALEHGADLVTFSGDKLLGGPQGGIVVGRAHLIEKMRRHPAARALRVDGSTAAALAATFAAYLAESAAQLPVWRMASLPAAMVEERARQVLSESGGGGRIVEGVSTLGAGSTPGAEIPTFLIEVPGADAVHARLLAHDPPILLRRSAGKALIDLRTVDPVEDAQVAAALRPE